MEAATGEMLLGAGAVVNPGLLQYHKQFEALRSHSSEKRSIFEGYGFGRHGVRCENRNRGRRRVLACGAKCIEAGCETA